MEEPQLSWASRGWIALGWVCALVVTVASIVATAQPLEDMPIIWRTCQPLLADERAALIWKLVSHVVLLCLVVVLRWSVFASSPWRQPKRQVKSQVVLIVVMSLAVTLLAALFFWFIMGLSWDSQWMTFRKRPLYPSPEEVCNTGWSRWPIVNMYWATPGLAVGIDVVVGWFRFKAGKRQLVPWATVVSFVIQVVGAIWMLQR